jgi:hypothetical protein
MRCLRFVGAFLLTVVAAWSSPLLAGPRIEIVIGSDAPKLTRFAAQEMSGQLKTLFDAEVTVRDSVSAGAANVILLGQPATNPGLAKAIGDSWPKLSDQGIVLKSVGPSEKPRLVVGGGSPTATLWAVYELGHRYGLRYMLSGDALPAKPAQFTLDKFDILLEPTLQTRGWQLMGGFPYISDSWGLEDQQRLVRQLVKLKFNHLVLTINYAGPYFASESDTINSTSFPLLDNHRFPVDGDTPGRKAFKGAKEFVNPDFADKVTVGQAIAAGRRMVQGLIDLAHELGMTAGVEVIGNVPIGQRPSTEAKLTREMAQAADRACMRSYPSLDALYVDGDESGNKVFHASLIKDVSTSQSGRRELNFVFVNPQSPSKVVDASSAQCPKYLIAQNSFAALMHAVGQPGIPKSCATVRLSLSDSFSGVLPQMGLRRMHEIVSELRKSGWSGFEVSGPMVGDLDPAAQYLSRVGFDASVSPDSIYHELFDTLCGSPDVTTRLIKGFDHIEQANENISERWREGLTRFYPNYLIEMVRRDPGRAKTSKEVTDLYMQAMNEMFRAHDNCNPASRRYIYYYARRCEFAMQYMNCIQAVHAAGDAKIGKDTEARLEQLGKAVEALYNALNSLGDVARDQSDRGAIAVLTEFAYRPLVKQLDKESEEVEKGK